MATDKDSPAAFLEFSPEPATRTSRVQDLLASTPARPTSTVTLPPRTLDELRNLPVPDNVDCKSRLCSLIIWALISDTVMQRLQSFLPAMEQSTHDLQQRAQADPASLDIEQLNPSAEEYIEMNLGLGVYESRANRRSQSPHADSTDSDTDSSTSSSSSSSGSDSDSDSDSDTSSRPDVLSILMSAVPPVPRMPVPSARPNIVILRSDKCTSQSP
ncbi:hypothetical protein FRC10_005160 [Ceratobasidium sp. 414]|nr:hypothetical protein FRC10_005160 [Ceratobasidium sp. 414]